MYLNVSFTFRCSPFDKIPRTFIPLMWAEERVRVTPEIASQIALVPLIVTLGQVVTGIMFAIGTLLICWYPTKYMSQLCRDPKSKNALLNPIVNSTTRSIALTPIRRPQKEVVALLGYNQGGEVLQNDVKLSESLLRPSTPPCDVISR